jgi:hypothetical protein
LIIEGTKFLWWVIDGQPARLTVSHPLYGTEILPAETEPEQQARRLARRLLAEAAGDPALQTAPRAD